VVTGGLELSVANESRTGRPDRLCDFLVGDKGIGAV
jgi:hypothetical protein